MTDAKSLRAILAANKLVLKKQSRSFSIPILALDKSMKYSVINQYNLNKTIDTIEDNPSLSKAQKLDFIDQYLTALTAQHYPQQLIAELLALTPAAETFVFRYQPQIFALNGLLTPAQQALSWQYCREMAQGMIDYLGRDIHSEAELDQYCYYVAGSVGCYLTELLGLVSTELASQDQAQLRAQSIDFGLLLQKINITRDYDEDVRIHGRRLWPAQWIAQAKGDLSAVLNQLCYQICFRHGPPAIAYYQAIPGQFLQYRWFLRYLLSSALEYCKILRGNQAVLAKEKVKLPKTFYLGLLGKVMAWSDQQFVDYCQQLLVDERPVYEQLPLVQSLT